MKRLALCLVVFAFALTGCSRITMLRTEEIQSVGTGVQVAVLSNLDTAVQVLKAENDSLRLELDRVNSELEKSALMQKRMMAEITMLSRRVGDESERNDSRQEEIIYRLDMLLGKSDKILAKKVVVSGVPNAPISMDSVEREAERLVEAEALFNTARSDYHRGEYKLAYNGFKQVYEQMKEGELGENSLYWMALCLVDVNQVEKAKKIFDALTQSFPNGQKVCSSLFKLAAISSSTGDVESQKQYLQKILSSKSCAASGEFEQAAEILQDLLEGKEVPPQPISDKKPEPAADASASAPAENATAASAAADAPTVPAEGVPAATAPMAGNASPAAPAATAPMAGNAATAPMAGNASPESEKSEEPAKKKTIPSFKKN